MRRILHIVTNDDDALAKRIQSAQKESSDLDVHVIDLTKPDADYEALLNEIFAADSVQVW